MTPFIRYRRLVIKGRMTPMRVVPPLDELEDRHPGLPPGLEPLPIQELALKRSEETLAHRVVVAIAYRAHRWAYTGSPTPLPEGNRRVY